MNINTVPCMWCIPLCFRHFWCEICESFWGYDIWRTIKNGFSEAKASRQSMMREASFYRRDLLYVVMEVGKMLSWNSAFWFCLVFPLYLLNWMFYKSKLCILQILQYWNTFSQALLCSAILFFSRYHMKYYWCFLSADKAMPDNYFSIVLRLSLHTVTVHIP